MTVTPRLTILADNNPGLAGLTSLWGFSALVETGERTILFDTGSNGRVLLQNTAALGSSLEQVDMVFLSHAHWDHMGGLDSVLEINADVTVVLHEGFSAHLIRDLRTLCREVVVVGADPRRLAPGVFTTGTFSSRPPEQGMVLDLGDVAAVIAGCAHPGIERIVERGVSLLGRPVDWAVGGFHLGGSSGADIARTVRALQDLGVTDVVPTHCTGDAATAAFERAYGERCLRGGPGRVVHLSTRRSP
ncbi:MAG: MBL fold metallo-hydrolase [Thermoleophilia bacterium]|nr:MBL fold metallo-hydrolase [Thermoleophilia bacterium]